MRLRLLLVMMVSILTACATGGTAFDHCKIKVVGVEKFNQTSGEFDVEYRVRGNAGSPAQTWLAAKTGSGEYISGGGVEVPAGPFEAIVDLKLTGRPQEYTVVLEVAGKRCKAKAPAPTG